MRLLSVLFLTGFALAQSTASLEQLLENAKFEEAYLAASKVRSAAAQAIASRAANFQGDFFARPADKAAWFARAENSARESIRLDPQYAKGYLYLAQAQGRLSQHRGILESLSLANSIRDNAQKALELDPKLDEARLTLAVWNQELASSGVAWLYGAGADQAVRLMAEIVGREPGNPVFRLEYGNILLRQDRRAEALRQWQAGLGIAPQNALEELIVREIRQAIAKNN